MDQDKAKDDRFEFPAGVGVIRSKITRHAIMYYGRIALPEHGQCFVDGTRQSSDKEMELSVKRASDRKLVAKLTLPTGTSTQCEGQIVMYTKMIAQGGTKSWKVQATVRTGVAGAHMALRLPDVHVANPSAF